MAEWVCSEPPLSQDLARLKGVFSDELAFVHRSDVWKCSGCRCLVLLD